MKLIAGLGNPGPEYRLTRHNVGFMVVDKLAERHPVRREQQRFDAVVGETELAGEKTLLVKPLTFMNRSGQAVAPIIRWYKLDITDVIIVYDDLDLTPGRLRIRPSGSGGGHKGMTDIIRALGRQDIGRLRLGIGRPPAETISWVLGRFFAEDMPLITSAVEKAADALECWSQDGITRAMNRFNEKGNNEHNIQHD
jgi:PTH1 family peptidyl-tRNA hydrolase